MERRDQLRNVAFGGAWSEQIAGREALRDALAILDEAADAAVLRDIRQSSEVRDALAIATKDNPKEGLLRDAWVKAAALPDPAQRCRRLADIATRLRIAQLGLLE